MKCEFCKSELKFTHHENEKKISVYECYQCPVLVAFHYDENLILTKLDYLLDKQGHIYMWTNNYVENNSYITDLTVFLKDLKSHSPVLVKFSKLMKINPSNVMEKFGFYMVFI